MTWGHMLIACILLPLIAAAIFALASDRVAHRRRWRAEEPFEIWPYPKEK